MKQQKIFNLFGELFQQTLRVCKTVYIRKFKSLTLFRLCKV